MLDLLTNGIYLNSGGALMLSLCPSGTLDSIVIAVSSPMLGSAAMNAAAKLWSCRQATLRPTS